MAKDTPRGGHRKSEGPDEEWRSVFVEWQRGQCGCSAVPKGENLRDGKYRPCRCGQGFGLLILSKMKIHWRRLNRVVTWSDLCFKMTTWPLYEDWNVGQSLL